MSPDFFIGLGIGMVAGPALLYAGFRLVLRWIESPNHDLQGGAS